MIPEIQFTSALCIDMKFQELKFLHVMKTTGCKQLLPERGTHAAGDQHPP
jgi:hypothetical protein